MDPLLMTALPAFWLLAAGALIAALELITPGAMLLWIGTALMAAGVATLLLNLDASGQILVFLIVLATSIASALLLRKARPPADLDANPPDAGLIGRIGRVDSPFDGGRGRVHLGDTHWSARSYNSTDLPAGQRIRVRAVENGVLVVEPLDATN